MDSFFQNPSHDLDYFFQNPRRDCHTLCHALCFECQKWFPTSLVWVSDLRKPQIQKWMMQHLFYSCNCFIRIMPGYPGQDVYLNPEGASVVIRYLSDPQKRCRGGVCPPMATITSNPKDVLTESCWMHLCYQCIDELTCFRIAAHTACNQLMQFHDDDDDDDDDDGRKEK